MLPKGLYNHTKFATYFLNMGLTPPPFEQCSKKMRIWWRMAPLIKVILQAVLDDNQVVVRLLLLNGADVNKPDVDG